MHNVRSEAFCGGMDTGTAVTLQVVPTIGWLGAGPATWTGLKGRNVPTSGTPSPSRLTRCGLPMTVNRSVGSNRMKSEGFTPPGPAPRRKRRRRECPGSIGTSNVWSGAANRVAAYRSIRFAVAARRAVRRSAPKFPLPEFASNKRRQATVAADDAVPSCRAATPAVLPGPTARGGSARFTVTSRTQPVRPTTIRQETASFVGNNNDLFTMWIGSRDSTLHGMA